MSNQLYDELLLLLDRPSAAPIQERPVGSGQRAWSFCPAHPDGTKHGKRSLSLSHRFGLDCFGGCEFRDIVKALRERAGVHPARPVPRYGSPTNGRRRNGGSLGRVTGSWVYEDESGQPLFRVVRMDGPAGKQFLQQHFRESCVNHAGEPCKPADAGWRWGRGGARYVLYRLPELLAADAEAHVFVVEGEKCADALIARGLTATTNAGGAGKWRAEYADQLRDRRVVILPDNDPPGADHAEQAARSLLGVAAEVRSVVLPGLPFKGDVADWFAAGGKVETLLRLVEAAPVLRQPSKMFPKAVDTRVLDATGIMA